MKKIVVLSGGLVVAGSAAVIGAGVALSQPIGDQSSYNVVGEPYAQALQTLKSQGVKAYFGGSFGSVLPESQCLVDQEKEIGKRMLLMLDCTQKAADEAAAAGPSGGGGPTVGSNGITTVTPTPVVPIAGAPGPAALPSG